jgi:hypothetical protein
VAPSGQGKTVLIQNMILNQKLYRGCFERVYLFTPSVDIDATWTPVKKYITDTLKVDVKKEPCWFADYNPGQLQELIDTQFRIVEHLKAGGETKLPSILIVVDDHSDHPEFTRNDRSLHLLFCRGRHAGISTIISGQRLCSVAPIVRLNCSGIVVFKLRNLLDLQKFLEELSAVVEDRSDLEQMYRYATNRPHGFLYVNLLARDLAEMFFADFGQRLIPDGEEIRVETIRKDIKAKEKRD